MVMGPLKPNDAAAAPNTGLAAVVHHHCRTNGGLNEASDKSGGRGSPNSTSLIETDDSPYKNLPPNNFFPNSMLARQVLGGLSLYGTLATAQKVLVSNWFPNPTSPPPTPVNNITKTRNNNNHLVTRNSTSEKKTRRRIKTSPVDNVVSVVSSVDRIPDPPLSPPTSGSSPQSNGSGQEISCKNSDRNKLFVCKECNRSFGYKHVLQNHERTHTGETPFPCKECPKRFKRDHHLKTHMRLHTGEKPFHCNHCDRNFVQVANLRRHLRVHTGEKPYVCDMCPSKFSDSNQLKSHVMTHSGEKPYQCTDCNGNFRRRHHLNAHRCPAKPSDFRHSPHSSHSPHSPRSSHSPDLENMADMDDDSRGFDLEIDEDVDSLPSSPIHDYDLGFSRVKQEFTPTQSPENYLLSNNNNRKMRERKSRDIRRVVRNNEISPILAALTMPSCLPVQTEPEDLSMPKSKLRNQLTQNNNHQLGDDRNNYRLDSSRRSESPQQGQLISSFYNHSKLTRSHRRN